MSILTANQLKIIALISMTIDHIGVQIFPECEWMRIVGRLAFPIFAFMIGEGCRYTKNKKKYLLTVLFTATLCQVVYFFALNSLYQCILVTFSFSIILNFLIENAMRKKSITSFFFAVAGFFCVYMITVIMPKVFYNTDFSVDYGFFGVLVPVFVYCTNKKYSKLLAVGFGLMLLSLWSGGVQWYSLLALVLLFMYNGKRGKYNLKYLFYIYYPLHLVVIYGLSFLI